MEEQVNVNISKSRKTRSKRQLRLIAVGSGVLVVAALASVVVLQWNKIRDLENTDSEEAVAVNIEKDAQDLRDKVSKLMIVPDETPTIGTVDDASKLKAQEFFRDAMDGDKVLMFTEARRVVIYRESENRIVNSGPIVVTEDASATIPM